MVESSEMTDPVGSRDQGVRTSSGSVSVDLVKAVQKLAGLLPSHPPPLPALSDDNLPAACQRRDRQRFCQRHSASRLKETTAICNGPFSPADLNLTRKRVPTACGVGGRALKRSVPRIPAGCAAVVVAVLICASSMRAGAEPLRRGAMDGSSASHASQVSAHADPQTGELIAPPALDGEPPPRPTGRRITDQPEILPAQTAAGGVMVDLRDHFVVNLRASALESGQVTTNCEPRNAATTTE